MNSFYYFFVLLSVISISIGKLQPEEELVDLIADPDFRDVTLKWEYDDMPELDSDLKPIYGFQIHYCEFHAWGPRRCGTKMVTANEGKPHENKRQGRTVKSRSYNTRIGGLRMATAYMFQVRPVQRDLNEAKSNYKSIVALTKGFSARATQCLPDASEVEVSTGPYFGGRISVEPSDGGPERCFIQGNPASAQDAYTLRINHEECGSVVNDTTVSTYVIVQENLPILTHSTRRFLVICNYKPETLTVRAGLNLPNAPSSGNLQYYNTQSGSVEPFDDVDPEFNELESTAHHEARVAEDIPSEGVTGEIIFVVFLIMATFGGIVFAIWRMVPQSETQNLANSTFTRNRLFGLAMRKNRDKYSDVSSVYSISLSDKDETESTPNTDCDNSSEA